jgi:hypothetical protein
MTSRGRLWLAFPALLAAALFALNVYRAATQSVVIDEAMTYTEFVATPLSRVLSTYEANNHILHSLLCRVSTGLAGASGFTLRIPSLIAGALYLAAVFRLCLWLLGPTAAFAAWFAVIVCNPYVLDFLSAARGYGMGLMFLMWAVYLALGCLDRKSPALRRAAAVSALCGLAVAANLTYLFPAIALPCVLGALLARRGGARIDNLAFALAGPGLAIALAVLALPLRYAGKGNFYVGARSLRDMWNSIGAYTFFYRARNFDLGGNPIHMPKVDLVVLVAVRWGVCATLGLTAAAVVRSLRQRRESRAGTFLTLFGGTVLAAGTLTVAAHYALGANYPVARMGLFWIAAIFLLLPALAVYWSGRAATAAALIGALYFASSIGVQDYAEWRFDSGTKDILPRLADLRAPHPLRVGADWKLAATFEFYRRTRNLAWLGFVERMYPERVEQLAREGQFDCLVLLPDADPMIRRLGWTVIYRDPRSGEALAVPRASN